MLPVRCSTETFGTYCNKSTTERYFLIRESCLAPLILPWKCLSLQPVSFSTSTARMAGLYCRASNVLFHRLLRIDVLNLSSEGHARSRKAALGTLSAARVLIVTRVAFEMQNAVLILEVRLSSSPRLRPRASSFGIAARAATSECPISFWDLTVRCVPFQLIVKYRVLLYH